MIRFQGAINQYVRELQVARRASPHTVVNYARDLKAVARSATLLDIADWQSMTSKDIGGIVEQQHREGISGRSLARRLSAVRGLYNFLIDNSLASANPAQDTLGPIDKRGTAENVVPEQASRVLTQSFCDPMTCRDLAMFELMYSSGLRLAELVNIDLADLDLSVGQVRVTLKGGGVADLPVGDQAIDAINKWLGYRRSLPGADERAVFLSTRGKRIAPRTVQMRLKKLAETQELERESDSHTLQDSFTSCLLERSSDVRPTRELTTSC